MHFPSQYSMLVMESLSPQIEFLPLNYLVNMLAEVESQGNYTPAVFYPSSVIV